MLELFGPRGSPAFQIYFLFANEDVHQSTHHTDSTSQSALHHACSHCLWSWRICKAAEELARDCPCELLNIGSTGYGRGLTPLLHVVNGAGVHSDARCRIAEVLINRRADIEACDQQGNTPFLLASAAGFTDMIELLRARNANIRHEKTRGGGARALAAMSSGTTQLALKAMGVPPSICPPSDVPRSRKQGFSQSIRRTRLNLSNAVNEIMN